jgi:hypothetical protein
MFGICNLLLQSEGSASDSNLQLALALSASMQEAEECRQLQQDDYLLEAGLGHEVVEQQKMMLERFEFKRSQPAMLAPSNSKYKLGKLTLSPSVLN